MSSPPPTRRLAAVLLADVAGYSRMMERDESGTHRRLQEVRATITDPTIAAHYGRVVRSKGDDLLVEFGAATEALACAIEIQRAMAEHNRGLAADSRIEFRIGINLGDILVDGADIAGDGVNVAARLESLAEPGGIAVSAAVREQVRQLAGARFSDLGAHRVKNIGRPIRVYSVRLAEGQRRPGALRARLRRVRRPAAMAAALVAAFLIAWTFVQQHRAVAPEVPRLSVALLPVGSAADEADGGTFARGLTAALSSALGQALGVGSKVVLANSIPADGADADARSLGRTLGVRYVAAVTLSSVAESRRAAVTLVAADTMAQVWGSVIEVPARDHDDIATELVARLADGLAAQARLAETARGPLSDPPDAAWLVLRARAQLPTTDTQQGLRIVRELYEQALQQRPDFVPALSGLAELLAYEANDAESPGEEAGLLRRADEISLTAIAAAPTDAQAWRARALVTLFRGQTAAAREALDRALILNPYASASRSLQGQILISVGEPASAIAALDLALRLNPTGDDVGVTLHYRCSALIDLGRYADAIDSCNRAIAFTPDWPDFLLLTAAYAMQGDNAGAAKAKAELMRRRPGFRIGWMLQGSTERPSDFEKRARNLLAGLRRAGVPE